jgi:hypothetical protein
MVQVPEAMNAAVEPETVQTPVVAEVKATAKPELAVAESVSGVPTVCATIAPNEMVCASPLTVNVCATVGAGA